MVMMSPTLRSMYTVSFRGHLEAGVGKCITSVIIDSRVLTVGLTGSAYKQAVMC